MVRGNNFNRWRAKQSEVARKRRGKSSWGIIIWLVLFLVVVAMLVQLIALLFETANSVPDDLPISKSAPSMPKNSIRGSSTEKEKEMAPDPREIGPEPDLESLMQRLRDALAPFQRTYLTSIGETVPPCDETVRWSEELQGFLPGCVSGDDCSRFDSLEEAKVACESHRDCGGVTRSNGKYEMRTGNAALSSENDEVSYTRTSCAARPSAQHVWNAFRETMTKALDDKSLHLDTQYPTREDGSIYLSISSYRDKTCPFTLRNAFRAAKYPERLFVGIVQQNCNVNNCYTGTGWGSSRRWVKQNGPDVDCVESFCEEHPQICEKQIRILRLGERESYGPFFGRFLNSKIYRGENFYLQIDAHTSFRQDWDYWMIDQMKRTPSYPYSVISNYPPGGDPTSEEVWAAPSGYEKSSTPSALCGCSFEDAGGEHKTVRLRETSRSFSPGVDASRPHHSAFIAAGFFIAHGSLVNNVPFDPFMPYLFMGEEISLSIRFWTSGYDIYGPAVDLLRHEYVRKESPKFWESVTMVFNNPGIHNDLTDLIIPRVQALVGWKDQPARDPSVLSMLDRFHCGKVRTARQFVRTMNIQIKSLSQKAPKWCLKGMDQPEATSTKQISN